MSHSTVDIDVYLLNGDLLKTVQMCRSATASDLLNSLGCLCDTITVGDRACSNADMLLGDRTNTSPTVTCMG